MGLLGHILRVEFKMRRVPSRWIWAETERVRDIDEFLAGLGRTAPGWPMTMGWIDCLTNGSSMGRGILTAGRWATAEEAPAQPPPDPKERTFPIDLPNWALNPVTASLFNTAYYWRHMAQRWSGLDARPMPSSIRSTPSSTGTAPTGREASLSTSACCREQPAPPPSASSCSS